MYIQKENMLIPENIDCIQAITCGLAVFGHNHCEVEGVSSAKMSIPFSVASAIVLNDGGIEAMSEESVKDKRILSLSKKVTVIEESAYSAELPKKRIAKLIVKLKNKKEFTYKVTYPKGEPENPINDEEIRDKYNKLNFINEETS